MGEPLAAFAARLQFLSSRNALTLSFCHNLLLGRSADYLYNLESCQIAAITSRPSLTVSVVEAYP